MKEAFFATNLFFDFDRKPFEGGMEIYLREMVSVFQEEGYNIKILQRWYKNEIIHEHEGLEVEGVSFPQTLYGLIWKKKIKGNPSIIHLNDIMFSFPFGDKKTTATFHGVGWDMPTNNLPYEFINQKHVRLKAFLMRKYMMNTTRFGIKKIKKILSVDSSLLHIVQHEMPNYRSKIDVLPNFVDTTKFYPKASTKRKFAIDDNHLVILYPRNISFSRGYFILYDIIYNLVKEKRLNCTFLVAGSSLSTIGKSFYSKKLYDELSRNDLVGNVVFLGSVLHENMPDVYNAADIVIIPSFFSEGTSLSALESMACGKPVVASNVGGLNDLIIHDYNGLLVKPDSREFTTQIIRLIENDDLRRQVSLNAAHMAKTIYDKKKWRSSIIEFFGL